ncbi:MAG: hypothetical protein IRZ00_04690 [Gemmatimonadetes bacterium]|nr:hypothetical protein [Gemmatimonadota bacterium]
MTGLLLLLALADCPLERCPATSPAAALHVARDRPPALAPRAARLRPHRKDGLEPREDKLKHFFMAFAITSVGYGVARIAVDHGAAVGASVTAAALAGIGKELYDARHGGDASAADLAWDALGIGAGTGLVTQVR